MKTVVKKVWMIWFPQAEEIVQAQSLASGAPPNGFFLSSAQVKHVDLNDSEDSRRENAIMRDMSFLYQLIRRKFCYSDDKRKKQAEGRPKAKKKGQELANSSDSDTGEKSPEPDDTTVPGGDMNDDEAVDNVENFTYRKSNDKDKNRLRQLDQVNGFPFSHMWA